MGSDKKSLFDADTPNSITFLLMKLGLAEPVSVAVRSLHWQILSHLPATICVESPSGASFPPVLSLQRGKSRG